jgi:hypothetical protein
MVRRDQGAAPPCAVLGWGKKSGPSDSVTTAAIRSRTTLRSNVAVAIRSRSCGRNSVCGF